MGRLLTLLLAVLLGCGGAYGQAQMSSGDIKGRVLDPLKAGVPGAIVTATAIDTGIERRITSDDHGEFRFFALKPGDYALRAEKPNFAAYTRSPIPLTVGQSVEIDLPLQLAADAAEILVQLPTPVLEPDKTAQSDTITTGRIVNLPINQRDYLEHVLGTPAVTDSSALIGFAMPQTPTSRLSFLGQNGRSNCVNVDGVDNNDNAVGAVRATIGQEAVQEFQISRANFAAEFGRCSGGLINIVSKSGTRVWRGNVFLFARDQALDARNAFAFGPNGSSIDPPFSRQQAGFTLGGPIDKDRTFVFLSYEGLRRHESRFVTFLENTDYFAPTSGSSGHQRDVINALLASSDTSFQALGATLNGALTTSIATFPATVQLLESDSGVFPFRSIDNTASLRLDHTLSASHQLFGRINFTNEDTDGGSFGGLKGPSRGANYKIQDYGGVFGDSQFWGSNRVNEFRFQFASRRFDVTAADPFGPEITINGVAALGRDFFLPSKRHETRYQFLDNFTFVAGGHQLKVGGDFNHLPYRTSTEVFLGGRFIFGEGIPLRNVIDTLGGAGTSANIESSATAPAAYLDETIRSIQAFNLGLPLVYQQGFGNPAATLSNKLLSAYVQDTFHPLPRLTVNAGLRYDLEFQPTPIHRDKNNWAPRLGFTYSLAEKTLVRGGYGIYYAPVFEAIAFVARVLNGQQISQVFLPLAGLPALGIPATSAQVWELAKTQNILGHRTLTAADIAPLGILPGVTPPVLLSVDSGLVNPYSQQFSLGVDRELPGGVNLSVSYLGNRGVKLLRSRNINLKQTGSNAYGPIFAPIDPLVLQDSRVESAGSGIYHGLAVSALKRYTRHAQFQVAYTWSKAINDTTDFITDLQPANPLDIRAERSLSSFDQRHRLVVSGVFESPFERGMGMLIWLSGLKLAPILTLASGRPFNVLLGFDANQDTNANTDRPLGIGRNAGTGPGYATLDLRLAREFRIARDPSMKIEAVVEAFNIFNRVNYSGVNTVVGAAPLPAGPIRGNRAAKPSDPLGFTSAFDPRQIQLGAKLTF